MNNNSQCESCSRWEVAKVIYFNDLGPTFLVCRSCAVESEGFGCSVLELGDDGQVMVSMPESGVA